ncbi:Pikachurin [Chionoecetes opilio]|uniref:Pikachurin n=1 Tax=Chionoecetes opilio TaxID=41210 RepID=A0A8J4XWZ2_CHIOP|nr:Pikachurin [Chionoecetes opilio]
MNYSKLEASILYEKEASFVAILEDNREGGDKARTLPLGPASSFDRQLIDRADILNYDRYKMLRDGQVLEEYGGLEVAEAEGRYFTSPGPNLEQKVPSAPPNLRATQSLTSLCQLECGVGRCQLDASAGLPRCLCPLGRGGRYCHPGVHIETARFHGGSWVGFAPLREAYRDVQLTLEFKPEGGEGVLLVSGENDDLSGDFMAAVLVGSFVEFRWDCGSGAGSVRSPEAVTVGEWNRLTVYRHRWDVWLQLNDGHHVQGRSEGLFSRITFREPLYVGGSNNLTSLAPRLGVTRGLQGCVRRLQVNDHVYRFRRQDPLREPSLSADYAALDGWGITECIGDACSEVECKHGGKCVASTPNPPPPPVSLLHNPSHTTPSRPLLRAPLPIPTCSAPLVPSFNGSSHLVFPALGGSVLSWLEVEVVFRAATVEGVLLYEAHRSDGTGDFIALTLARGHVLFTIDLGSGVLTLRTGVWHWARVSRTGRRAWLYVDDQPVVSGLTPGGFTMLSLSHPLYLGGVPPASSAQPPLPATTPFQGCVQKLAHSPTHSLFLPQLAHSPTPSLFLPQLAHSPTPSLFLPQLAHSPTHSLFLPQLALNGRPVHLVSGAVSGSNVASCDHPCSQRPCDNGGVCDPQGGAYACRCPLGFKDAHCRSRVVTQAATPSFSGRSFLKYDDPEILKRVSGDKLHLWLRFRSEAPDGLLVWAGEGHATRFGGAGGGGGLLGPPSGDSLTLGLQDGCLSLSYNLGSGFARLTYNSSGRLDDGQWHTLRLSRYEREARVWVDGGEAGAVVAPGDLVQLNLDSPLYIAGGEAMIRGLQAVLTAVWQSGTIPPDWKRGLVVPIWKGKGDRQDCNNYRGITLLSVPGKVLVHLLLTQIRSHLLKHQRPQQSGFTPGKSTTDRILALRVLVERRREFRQGMLAAYVDLKKAFDSVHRESLWDLLRLRGIPARTIGLMTGLYSGTESAVKCGGGVSSFFPVNTGVRQGCVLAPSLFNACMDWVLDKVVDQSDCGASVGNTKITDLVFADDAVIFAESLEVLVMALEALHEEAKPLGLEVSWLKTKVQVFGDLLDEAVQTVHACGEDIEILESFTYLGSAVHNDGGSRQEALRRIGIAHGVMDSLSGSIWRCRYLCRRTKIRIFKSLVIPVLLYGCGREMGLSSSSSSGVAMPGLRGCVADFTLATDYHVDLITQAAAGQNIDYC